MLREITTKHASNRPVMFVTHKRVLWFWVIYDVRVCFHRQNWKRVMTTVMVINRTTPGWPGGAVLSIQMTSSSSFPHRYDHSPTSSPPSKGFSLRKWGNALWLRLFTLLRNSYYLRDHYNILYGFTKPFFVCVCVWVFTLCNQSFLARTNHDQFSCYQLNSKTIHEQSRHWRLWISVNSPQTLSLM